MKIRIASPAFVGSLAALALLFFLARSLDVSPIQGGKAPENGAAQSHGSDPRGSIRIADPGEILPDNANAVDLSVGPTGKVVDWSVTRGRLTDDMKTAILFGHFEPADSGTRKIVLVQKVQP